jgi:hypothetical protein
MLEFHEGTPPKRSKPSLMFQAQKRVARAYTPIAKKAIPVLSRIENYAPFSSMSVL